MDANYWLENASSFQICEMQVGCDYLYLSGISIAILSPQSRELLLALRQTCRATGDKVIFDNNCLPRLLQSQEEMLAAYRDILACTDIAFLTLDDEDMLWGKQQVDTVLDHTRALGVSQIVIKCGAGARLVAEANGALQEVPEGKLPKEKVVDTTNAGDSFSAGYLAGRLTAGNGAAGEGDPSRPAANGKDGQARAPQPAARQADYLFPSGVRKLA